MSDQDTAPSRSAIPPVVLTVLIAVVVALVLLVRPGGDDEPADATGAPSPTPTAVTPTATPDEPPSEEEWCAAYGKVVAALGDFAATPDDKAIELLRQAADDLLASGIPTLMVADARSGYFLALSEVYSSIGEVLDQKSVVGAFEEPAQEDPSVAFDDFLRTYCPGW